MSIVLGLLLLLLAGGVWAQEPAPAMKLEANKLTLQRAREMTARCEDDLGLVWAQAQALQKTHQEKLQELDTLKSELEALKKPLEASPAGRTSRHE